MTMTLERPESLIGATTGFAVRVARERLQQALRQVGRAVSHTGTLPVLKSILLTAQGESLSLAATDLELGIVASCPAEVLGAGQVTLTAKLGTDLISRLDAPDITLSAQVDGLQVAAGRSTYRLETLNPESWPSLPEVSPAREFTLLAGEFARALRQVTYALSDDQTRPVLTAMLLRVQGTRITLVARDEHRFALRYLTLPRQVPDSETLVPGRACAELERMLAQEPAEAVTPIRPDPNQFGASGDSWSVVSRVVEGQFPRFERNLPTRWDHRLVVDRQALLAAIRRAELIADHSDARWRVILTWEPERLVITAEGGALLAGAAREEVPATLEGEPFALAVNVRYLRDAINATEAPAVALEGTHPEAPLAIRGVDDPSWLSLIQPMKILGDD
jgi:DNA polymerase III subunit beta